MTRGFPAVTPFLLLFLMEFATAGIQLWPSMHIALSNASVFVDYSSESNFTDHKLTVSLVDIDRNVTVLTMPLPFNQSEGSLEFNCSYFLYAGNFRFRLEQKYNQAVSNKTTTWWWSPILHVHWPTFHLAVDQGNSNQTSNGFRIGVYTNDHFHPCPDSKATSLHLDVSYLEQVQIGRNNIDKVQNRLRHDIRVVRSQHVEIACASPLTERGFIQISIKSPHNQQDIKSSGPLYLSSIFSYKLLVDNIYKSGCVGTVSVRRISPPCIMSNGKVLLYKEESNEKTSSTPLAFNFLTQMENETEFNCSIFDAGRNKYCFHFTLVYSQAPSLAHTCVIVHRHTEMWGPWQPWSGCSVTCGEGVRERERECLLPSGGGMQCTGMVREQSHCSLEDCTEAIPPPSLTPPPAVSSPLAGNLVVVAGISLCLAVILITIFITVWRKLCHAPKCSSMRRGSIHSPSGWKNSDEASICGHSLQRPSLSDSLQIAPLQKGLTLPAKQGPSDRGVLARQQSMTLPLPLPQDPERMSPSSQKIVPPIFGYRLAQQQLKEMKKKGLKEATQVYHVSQSPVDDTMLEATPSGPSALTPVPQEVESPEEASSSSHFRIKSHFLEPTWPPKNTGGLSDRHKVDMLLGPTRSAFSANARRLERTADWVEMVERSRVNFSKNPNFRRTSSFHENNQQQLPPPRPYRERSMTQVTPRQLPDGSCRNRTWEHTLPELEVWSCSNPRRTDRSGDQRRRPWVDTPPSQSNSNDNTLLAPKSAPVTPTKGPLGDRHRIARSPSSPTERAERAEQNWSRRGPSPIQRNILARKLREANSSTCQRQRSSTFSSSDQRRGRCRSLPLSADYSSSPYSLTESEQHMIDISGYLGEEDGVEVLNIHRLT